MKLGLLSVLCCTTLLGCESRTAQGVFNRPDFNKCITLGEKGLMVCNGITKNIPTGLIVPETHEDYEAAESYYEEREYGHFICVIYPKRCTKNH
jgi:hypothetical protein